MNKLFTLLAIFFCWIATVQATEVETIWLSNAVVPGEQTRLFIIMTDGSIPRQTPLPHVKGASLRWAGNGNYIQWPTSPNQSAFLMEMVVIPDEAGTVQIPSIPLQTNGGRTIHMPAQTLHVYPYSAIKWDSVTVNNGTEIRYGMLWHVDNPSPYPNQPVPCELKIYAPENVLGYPALPTINTTNMATWRFEPTMMGMLGARPCGQVLYKGANWLVMTFQSTIFPLRSGEVSASGTIRAQAILPEADPLIASFSRNELALTFNIPELKIKAEELPTPAPASFTNAVGNYRVSASTEAQDLTANEPITVTIRVEGSGNIHSINCPTLTDAANWKLYPPNKLDPGKNTRTIEGTVEFQQMMRPIAQTDAVPPFELSFFDPATQQYKTVRTAPIPLAWKASAITGVQPGGVGGTVVNATPPPAGTIPVAEMTDIYGLPPFSVMAIFRTRLHLGWYFLACVPALILLLVAAFRRMKARRAANVTARERMRAFKKLTALPRRSTSADFLRAAGNFIENHIPSKQQDEGIRHILHCRDEFAFRADHSTESMPSSERRKTIAAIKKVIAKLPLIMMAALLAGAFFSPVAMAQDVNDLGIKAYEQGEYKQAAEAFEKQASDHALNAAQRAYAYYGIGNAYYRMNKPGQAALNYRRALTLSPFFTEARMNLSFIERKEGAILPLDTTENHWLTFMPYTVLAPLAIISGAVMLTFLALFTVTRKHGILLTIMSTLSGLICLASLTNWCMYPRTPDSVPVNDLLIVTKNTDGLSAAMPDSASVTRLTESTPLIFKVERGSWYYAETFRGTPVWLPKDCAERL